MFNEPLLSDPLPVTYPGRPLATPKLPATHPRQLLYSATSY